MSWTHRVFAVTVALLVGPVSSQAVLQVPEGEPVRVQEIRENKQSFRNEVVVVEGFASQFLERAGRTTSFYFVRDDWGALIQVRTSGNLPQAGQRYRVTGVVGLDERLEPYISEEGRVDIDSSRGVRAILFALNLAMEEDRWSEAGAVLDSLSILTPDATNLRELRERVTSGRRSSEEVASLEAELERAEAAGDWDAMESTAGVILGRRPENAPALRAQVLAGQRRAERQRRVLLWGLGIAVLFLAFGAWLTLRTRGGERFVPGPIPSNDTPAAAPPGESVPPEGPPASSVDHSTVRMPTQDFKTVKVFATQRVLPGKLVVERDGQDETIPLYADAGSWEVSIGRESPGMDHGIRIKDRTNTVSRKQATIRFSREGSEFHLVNSAGDASNPTTVNDKRLKVDEEVPLVDGDRLRMGQLEATFKQT